MRSEVYTLKAAPWRRLAIEAKERVLYHLQTEHRVAVRQMLEDHARHLDRVIRNARRAA